MNKELLGMLGAEGVEKVSELIDDFEKLEEIDKDEINRIANKYPMAFWWFTDQGSGVERFDKGMMKDFFYWNTDVFIRIVQEVEKINDKT